MKKVTVKQLAVVGIMTALVFVASWIMIPISTGIDNTRIHLGNVMCLLSGLMMGGLLGGCASGIGSAIFDLTSPIYIAYAPATLVLKFFIGFIAGHIAYAKGRNGGFTKWNITGSIIASVAYSVLYLIESYIVNRLVYLLTPEAALVALVPKIAATLINGLIACVIAVPLAAAIKAALKRANVSL